MKDWNPGGVNRQVLSKTCNVWHLKCLRYLFNINHWKIDPCLLPKPKTDGRFKGERTNYEYGERIFYECNYVDGYMFGSPSLQCGENGTWLGEEPYCAYEEKILRVVHDSLENKELFDKSKESCVRTGVDEGWNVVIERNASMFTTVIEIIIRARREYDFKKNKGYGVDNCKVATITEDSFKENYRYLKYAFECHKTYLVHGKSLFVITPTDKWYEMDLCEIYIYMKPRNICPSNVKICNGDVNITSGDSHSNPRMLLNCKEGHKLEGNSVLYCKDGTWPDFSKTKCTRISCNNIPPQVVNGKWFEWSRSEIYYYGNRLILSCDNGYTLSSGVNFTQCQKDGSWSRADAVCLKDETLMTLLIPIATSMIILLVLVIIIISACILCCRRRKSEKSKEKIADEIYSEPSYSASELCTKSHPLPPLPPPNPLPFYSDPMDTYYTIDDEVQYYEPYSSRNGNQVVISQNTSKINPTYVCGGKDVKSQQETPNETIPSNEINIANKLYDSY